MLTGRTPFSAPTPQAMLAAQVTKKPEPVTAHREAIPPALAALVMRCLAKHPADRFQWAGAVLEALEQMVTPSGGITPTGSAPYDAVAAAAAARAHPLRVAGLFALTSVAVLGVVYFLMNQLGLPGWVMPWAVGLLVAGLPIMVVTGLIERRRALARTTGHMAPPPRGLQGWLAWRRALGAGAVAFDALGVAAAAYMTMRLLGIGPLGTLVASGVIKNREPVILADFENRSADSTLGPSLTAAFRVDLSESPTVRLVDARAIAAAVRRMERPSATPLDAVLAREIAQRENLKAVVTGEIDPVGKGYVISASLIAAPDGQVLTALRETADNDAALIGALDRLSRKLRERIGESLKSIRASEPLARVTTGSLDALREYSKAGRAEEAADYEQAAAGYWEATATGTRLAIAQRKP